MEKVTINKKEYEEIKSKSEKWDALGKQIEKFYCDESGEYSEDSPENNGDLADIGEAAAMAYGWL